MSRIYLTALIGFLLAAALVIFPQEAFAASLEGLKLWLEVVLPALLPFMVMARLLMEWGVVQFIGALLEPVMRPLFRIPGASAFAVALGLASGYPMGAKITAELRREELCTQIEAERLLCFANTAGPLFIAGAVSVGMFGRPDLAAVLFTAHYLSAFMVGILMRFYGSREPVKLEKTTKKPLSKAVQALVEARRKNSRPFGVMFYEAVSGAFTSLLFIGGCITAFSVLSRILVLTGITPLAADLLAPILSWFRISRELTAAVIAGVLEIDIGALAISKSGAPIRQMVTAVSAVLAWSGLSVHAQVAAMIHGTDIRMKPYITARVLHALCAGITAALVYPPLTSIWSRFKLSAPASVVYAAAQPSFIAILAVSAKMAVAVGILLFLTAVVFCLINRIIFVWIGPKS